MWIIWSYWGFTMFQGYCPCLIDWRIVIEVGTCWELIANENITTIFIVLDLVRSWVADCLTWFTTNLIIGKGLTCCLINVRDNCFLIGFTVNNWGISSWVRWCHIWNVCHITWDDWCWCDTTLSWIVWIIRILWSWRIWNWVAIWVNWNDLTEFLINHFICSFWVFWCNCLTTCFSFIRIIVFNDWDFYFAIVMTVFSPCCCTICLILLTCEGIVALNIIFWCGWTSSFKRYCLFRWLCHIICFWYIDDWRIFTWFIRCYRCSWLDWLTWFRWIIWIWKVWFITWNIWNDRLTWFRWICWIVRIFNTWCWWEVWIVWCFWFWNQASKWFVSYGFFKIILSNCLRSNTCFISVVTCQTWCWNCSVSGLIWCPWCRWKFFTCDFIQGKGTCPCRVFNVICWCSYLTVWYHILNSWCHIFLPLICRWVLRTVWIIWIDWICWIMWIIWSYWCFTMFQGYCPNLINGCICVISSSCWELIIHKNITTILVFLDFSCSWVVNSFARFTRNLIIFKCCTSILIYVLDNSFLFCLTVDNRCISSWVIRSYTWCICHITWDDWSWSLATLSWILWIIVVLWSWCTWNWCIGFINWDDLTKWFISNLIRNFWLVWSNCLRSSFLLIGIVMFNNWNCFFTISVIRLIPCCCTIFLFTSKGEVILNFSSWSIIACSFKRYCLFSWFCYFSCFWYIDDWCIFTWFIRCYRCSWLDWLTWFRWIIWIWKVWFITWNIWNDRLTWFRWICWIVRIFNTWCWWEVWIVWCFWFWNQASKWFVSYGFFKIILSNCLRSNTCFISVVTCQTWCWNCSVSGLIWCPWCRWKFFTCDFIQGKGTCPCRVFNVICWCSYLTVWYHILNSWCHIFLPLICRWVLRTVWIIWIDWICWIMWIIWSYWNFIMF